MLNEHIEYEDLEAQCPAYETFDAFYQMIQLWLRTPNGKDAKRSVHIFLSLQQFWTCCGATEEQSNLGSLEPIQAEEMRLFTQMICLIRQAGHQVYLCLNSGIAHIAEDSGSEEQVAAFLRSTQQCVNAASDAGALVDLGTGFWTQHIKLWSDGVWFSVREKEDVLAQIIDSFIMRQKVLLHLAVNKEVVDQFDQMSALNLFSLKVFDTPWPDETEVMRMKTLI